jgi:hypothetical protein
LLVSLVRLCVPCSHCTRSYLWNASKRSNCRPNRCYGSQFRRQGFRRGWCYRSCDHPQYHVRLLLTASTPACANPKLASVSSKNIARRRPWIRCGSSRPRLRSSFEMAKAFLSLPKTSFPVSIAYHYTPVICSHASDTSTGDLVAIKVGDVVPADVGAASSSFAAALDCSISCASSRSLISKYRSNYLPESPSQVGLTIRFGKRKYLIV